MNASPAITAISSAHPAAVQQTDLWEGFFAARTANRRAARMAFHSVGVDQRHAVANPLEEDVSGWSTAARMERYLDEAMPLGKEAISAALGRAGLAPEDLGLLVAVSCTGYATPGIDIRLARDTGMAPDLERVALGHMGCHAALPALAVASRFVASKDRPALVLCLELPSLHLQPVTGDLDEVIIHALFSDAASAAVIEPGAESRCGYAIVDGTTFTDADSADAMTWTITDKGFRMTLSRHVPDILANSVGPVVDRLLARHGLSRSDIKHWAVHPGGPRVLDVVANRLELPGAELSTSRHVLASHGNCSSATMLLVLEELWDRSLCEHGEFVVALTFGPGLTLCAALLQATLPT